MRIFKNRVIGTAGLSKPTAIKSINRSVVKVTRCSVIALSVHSFLFTEGSRKR